MTRGERSLFESYLVQHDAAAWERAVYTLLPDIHEVDRNATQIWFHFFPLELAQAIASAENLPLLVRTLRLEGRYSLADQADASAWFLYGHRYWADVKRELVEAAESGAAPESLDLPEVIRAIGRRAAAAASADASLVLGIAAVGLMTLQQIGLERLKAGTGEAVAPDPRSPEQILAARRRNDSQGLAGLFRGIKARYTVTFDERRADARFPIINQQHLTTASAGDRRDYSCALRGTVEGPIPAQCRTASCGTCWVGVLAGAERLSPVDPHEARRMREFGYIITAEPTPIIRLACTALASGNVTIVIPPWNGFIGKWKGSRETAGAGPRSTR